MAMKAQDTNAKVASPGPGERRMEAALHIISPSRSLSAPIGGNEQPHVQVREVPATLLPIGKSRWEQLQHFIPVSRETWRKLCKAGKAPRPERISLRCTVFDNAQIHLWLANPSAYSVPLNGGDQ